MNRFTTIRTRLLSGLGVSALLQVIALAIAVIALFTTSDAVRRVSSERIPQTGLATQLAYASERMGDEIGSLVGADSDDIRRQSYQAFEERYAGSVALLERIDSSMVTTEHLDELQTARTELFSSAGGVNAAQERYLNLRDRLREMRATATLTRTQLQAALEEAIDGAEEQDVETLLRLGLSANSIATIYADLIGTNDPAVVNALEEDYALHADDARVNLAILQDAATPMVRELTELFAGMGEGEAGMFALRRDQMAAANEAQAAREMASGAVDRQTDAIAQLVSDIGAGAEQASNATLTTVELSSWVLSAIALLSLGCAGALGYFYVHRGILRRMDDLSGIMGRVSEGELDVEIHGLKVQDEIGEMSRALEVFRQNAIKAEQLNKEMIAAQEQRLEAERREREAAEQRRIAEAKAEKERREAEERARTEREAAAERERKLREDAARREMEERERQREREAEALRQRAEEEARLMREKAEAEEQARQEREAAAERRREEEERRRQEKLEAEERERKLREEADERERQAEKRRREAEALAMRQKAEEEKRRLEEK
ncbi:MAG: hypothetical protein V2I43_02955, partial [Parvularcula sp.]|nr:hypothetical protein [Parvularcula sp.]